MTQLWTTTNYNPNNDQGTNSIYSTHPSQHRNGSRFNNSRSGYQYSNFTSPYAHFPHHFLSNPSASHSSAYMPSLNAATMPYQVQMPPGATIPSQHRSHPTHPYYAHPGTSQRSSYYSSRTQSRPDIPLLETEDQTSLNSSSMRSEPVEPPLDGFPTVEDFDDLLREYVDNLSPKKQDKALIHSSRAHNIKAVLINKKITTVESAQFRFWVKKMFTLEPRESSVPVASKRICHEGKPVAIREKLFKILTNAHKQCQHGGRDKTSLEVRKTYSWVPKELISRFVKLCPTCQMRRGTTRPSAANSEHSTDVPSPDENTLGQWRRRSNSMMNSSCSASGLVSSIHSPLRAMAVSEAFINQNRWIQQDDSPPDTFMRDVSTNDENSTASASAAETSPTSPGGSYLNMYNRMTDSGFSSTSSQFTHESSPSFTRSTDIPRQFGNSYQQCSYAGEPLSQQTSQRSHPYSRMSHGLMRMSRHRQGVCGEIDSKPSHSIAANPY